MQFLILAHFNERFNALSPDEQREGSHAEWAKSREYYAAQHLRNVWVYNRDQGIVSLFEAGSREEIEALLADYPGVKAGWVSAEIRELEPYWGFFPERSEERNHVTGHGESAER